MAHCYHLHTILSIRHPQQAYVIPFTAYLPGGSSTAYPLCLLVVCILLFLQHMQSHITQEAFCSQCKNLEGNKIHQSSDWLSKSLSHCSSFPVALQLEPFGSLLVGLFNPLAFYLDGCGQNLPKPWSLLLAPDKDLCSHLWSLLPLLKQQRAFYKVMYIHTHLIVRCSLAYNESHRAAQMNLKGFRM